MKLPSTVRIATRRSRLALIQAEMIRQAILQYLKTAGISCNVELLPMLTSGDRSTDPLLSESVGKGLFTKEIEEALLDGRAEIAMHSLKDIPAHLPDGLVLAGCLAREDYRDALVAVSPLHSLADLPDGATIGTSSPRRAAQLKMLRPDLKIIPYRGNVPTRLEKLHQGEVDATILAVAGLKRLGMEDSISFSLTPQQMLPALGQGIIAMQCRDNNNAICHLLKQITHLPTWRQLQAERAILEVIEGDCRSPLAGLCILENDHATVTGLILNEDGSKHYSVALSGDPSESSRLGQEVGQALLKKRKEIWL